MSSAELRHQVNEILNHLEGADEAMTRAERAAHSEDDLAGALVHAKAELRVILRRIKTIDTWLRTGAHAR